MANDLLMRLDFLGTGTSQGVPVIGCACAVCSSEDPRDMRLRTSVAVSWGKHRVIVDVGPDFRQQVLRAGFRDLDAVLITHEHNDHVIGLDEIRPFNFMNRAPLDIYATNAVQQELKQRFAYVFDPDPYPGAPKVRFHTIRAGETFAIGGLDIRPILVHHGDMPVLGFRFGDIVYITDAKTISEEQRALARGAGILVLNALHHTPHHAHLNLSEALDLIADLKPVHTYLIHISHHMGRYTEINPQLPPGVSLAYDGLSITL